MSNFNDLFSNETHSFPSGYAPNNLDDVSSPWYGRAYAGGNPTPQPTKILPMEEAYKKYLEEILITATTSAPYNEAKAALASLEESNPEIFL